MKKYILLCSIIILHNTVNCQYPFTLTTSCPTEFNGQKIYLEIFNNDYGARELKIDSAIIVNNSFNFKGVIMRPSEYGLLHLKEYFHSIYFALDTGLNEIKILSLSTKSIKNKIKNKFFERTFINSKSNELYNKFDSLNHLVYLKYGNNPVGKGEELKKVRAQKIEILKKYKSNYYALKLLYTLSRNKTTEQDINELITIYDSLDYVIKNSPEGIQLYTKLTNTFKLAEGNILASQVPLYNSQGQVFMINNVAYKLNLIAFSAVWCGPCKKKIPLLKQMYNKYKTNGLEVYYINLDNDDTEWRKMINSYGMKWANLTDKALWRESEFAKDFNIEFIPRYILVDDKGKIIYNSVQRKDEDLTELVRVIIQELKTK